MSQSSQLPGGPSDFAARGLIDDAPRGYFDRWSAEVADRIRAATRPPRCCCQTPAELDAAGRCTRCYGWPEAER